MRARWLTVPALVVALAGCGTTPAHPVAARPDVSIPVVPEPVSPSVPTPRTTSGCLDPGVSLSVGEVDAAMGLRAVGVTLRNCGTAVYTVQGYPEVDILDTDRRVLDVTVLDGTAAVATIERYDVPPKRLDVPPGGIAVAVLVWRNLTTDAATVAKGAYVSVAPAPGLPRHTLSLMTDPGNTGKMGISPWIAG
ncbi:DUF4232 domain-containing protein [Dactylosporangium sp. NPDC005555]|uniref:DUF4232 domain-containing protein n=1 Tax=Dactylosporangium sp. NPDC005555 TaxID=3154889 RepID=UPI0033B0632B